MLQLYFDEYVDTWNNIKLYMKELIKWSLIIEHVIQ